ncbi:MAG TPA: CHAT domain-containing protein [Pyrinomonadaceae bacterium]
MLRSTGHDFGGLRAPTISLALLCLTMLLRPGLTAAGGEQLLRGQRNAREITRGTAVQYDIDLGASQYLRVLVEAHGVELAATLYNPIGERLLTRNCAADETTALSLIADRAGVYRLQVQPAERERASGRYEVQLVEVRRAVKADGQRLAAEQAYAAAQAHEAVWSATERRQAIEQYEAAGALWLRADEPREAARALTRAGRLYFFMGTPQTALARFAAALKLSQRAGDPAGTVRTLNELALAHLSLGQPQQAAQAGARARALSRSSADRAGEAGALNALGEVSYFAGDLQTTIARDEQALTIWRALGDRRGQAQTLLYLGYSYVDLSQLPRALDMYQQALALWQASNDQRGQALTLTAIGHLQSAQGEKQQALDYYQQALRLFPPQCDQIEHARLLNGLGFVYDELGEPQRALDYYQEALALFKSASHRRGVATGLLNVGEIQFALGAYTSALDYCRRALTMFHALADRRTEAFALKDIGSISAALGAHAEALVYFRRALALNRRGGDPREEASTLSRIGDTLFALGRASEARAHYERALTLSRGVRDRFGETATLFSLAQVERARGDLLAARTHAEAALKLSDDLRANVASQELRTTYFASAHRQYELYVDVLMQLSRQQPAADLAALALQASERGRARSLLESLGEASADIRAGADAALAERERALRQALNERAEKQMQLLSAAHTEQAARTLAHEIEQLTSDYEDVRAQIRVASPRYAALMQPRPLTVPEMQQHVLDDETIMLEYALGTQRSYLWALTRAGLTSYELPGRAEIESAALRFYETLTAQQPLAGESAEAHHARTNAAAAQLADESAALGRMLLGPVAGQLGSSRLLIVPDGALQYVPFAALTEPVVNRALIIGHEVVSQPSASALALLRQEFTTRSPAPRPIAVLADPVYEADDPRIAGRAEQTVTPELSETHRAFDDAGPAHAGEHIPRLLASRAEADAIMAVAPRGGLKALGFEATRAAALGPELSRYRIVHFATHGLLNRQHPTLSGVVLSLVNEQGRRQDGFLRLHDIYNMHLAADLVVLSACNTGLGKDVRGEGLIGLTRGFMYAGAAGVLTSLWKVDDEATAELMKQFYLELFERGQRPAAALRRAQLAVGAQTRWRAPYYWAGFVLQGEYRGRAAPAGWLSAHQWRTTYVGGALGFVSLAAGIFVVARRRRRARRGMLPQRLCYDATPTTIAAAPRRATSLDEQGT